jgi:hypothetical protein
MSIWLWIAIGAVLVLALLWWRQQQGPKAADEPSRAPKQDALDTVAAWPPEATRVLSGHERDAHQALIAALPECLVLAQVPLARFVKVPRRHSYTEWLTRAGHLCADLLVCDRSSQALAVVIIRSRQASERGAKRNERIKKVLNAAKLKVLFWNEGVIPDADIIRNALLPTPVPLTGPLGARPAAAAGAAALRDGGPDTEPRREPPPSTWFDDVESRPAPLRDTTDKPPPSTN